MSDLLPAKPYFGPAEISPPASISGDQLDRREGTGEEDTTATEANDESAQLIHYDAACQAIAAAVRVDEVKEIRDVAIAMKTYARQAKNVEMEADAIEIRMRATRRLDLLRQEQATTIGLSKGAREKGIGRRGNAGSKIPRVPTLAEAGIDKNLAKEGRRLGALSDKEFEEAVAIARENVGRVVRRALRGRAGNGHSTIKGGTETPRAASLGAVDNPQEKSRIPRAAQLCAVQVSEDDYPQPLPSSDALGLIDLVLSVDPDDVVDLLNGECSHDREDVVAKLLRILDGIAPSDEGEDEGEGEGEEARQ